MPRLLPVRQEEPEQEEEAILAQVLEQERVLPVVPAEAEAAKEACNTVVPSRPVQVPRKVS